MYDTECEANPTSTLISISSGQLPCNRIYFVSWAPEKNLALFRKSFVDFVSIALQNAIISGFTSIALPIIGCGRHACSVDLIGKMMVNEVKKQLTVIKTPLIVKFIVEPDRDNVYEIFRKHILTPLESKGQLSSQHGITSNRL